MEVNTTTESKPARRGLRLLLGALIGIAVGIVLVFCSRYLPDTSISSGSQAGGDDYFVVKFWGTVLHEETHPKGTLFYVPKESHGAFGPTPKLGELQRSWMFRALAVFCGTGALLGVGIAYLVDGGRKTQGRGLTSGSS